MLRPMQEFRGYPPLGSNTTYTPNQFFDVAVPVLSRGALRVLGYIVRRTLGWSDAEGNPRETVHALPWTLLAESSGVARSKVGAALNELILGRFIIRSSEAQAGLPARYELRWSEREQYVSSSQEFDGFYQFQGCRTYIPNAFFDYTIPTEPLSVVRVVAAIIRNTVAWENKYGFRRSQVSFSFTQLEAYTRLSRKHVSRALQQAIEHGHVCRIADGVFDSNLDQQRAAVYALRWADGAPSSVAFEQSVVPRETPARNTLVPKGHQAEGGVRSQKETRSGAGRTPGNRSQKDPSIKITDSNNRSKQQQLGAAAAETDDESFRLLREQGFDQDAARELAARYDLDRIRRQTELLPLRAPRKNPLGLLRRAIEGDWPAPESPSLQSPGTEAVLAGRFVAHYYAGFAGNEGSPVSEPTPGEVSAAQPYLRRLLHLQNTPGQVPDWGRSFGRFACGQSGAALRSGHAFRQALQLLGEGFYLQFQSRLQRERSDRLARARESHKEACLDYFLVYLEHELARVEISQPEAFSRFREHEARELQRLERTTERAPRLRDEFLADFHSRRQYLARALRFFSQQPGCDILGFWAWDARLNPQPFDLRESGNAFDDDCDHQPEGGSRQDDHGAQPIGVSFNDRARRADHRPGPAGASHHGTAD